MTSTESYFDELQTRLKWLPEADCQQTLAFYREYAADARLTSYAELSDHFGSPAQLAAKIYAEGASKEASASPKSGSAKSFQLGLAALFSLPLTLPLAIAVCSIGFALMAALISILFSVLFTLLVLGGTSLVLLVRSFGFLFPFLPVLWLKTLGGALVLGAVTAGAIWLLAIFVRRLSTAITALICRFIKRRTTRD